MKWYPVIRILLYLRDIESKEKNYEEIQVSQVRELIEVKEVITPYGRSGSEETIVFFRKT